MAPLPRSSRSGHGYPEAIPLRSIDTEHVAEELLKLFTRVGVPQEILTEGTNFTSKLMAEIYNLLHIQVIKTSPYHMQADSLVEHFNQTLKLMLCRNATVEGKDWNKAIPYLLFANREIPQASTGFSPLELVYGMQVRGPLDLLRESWEVKSENIILYVLTIQERLAETCSLVQENLARAQVDQKRWYDRDARER